MFDYSLKLSPKLVCRPALPMDTEGVIALTRKIWEGDDYVSEVWPEWLADPEGLLAVGEYGGEIVATGKLTRLSDDAWWLEGLRVHPDFKGRGFASHMQVYCLEYWRNVGAGTIRLATPSTQEEVHHMCDRDGFERVGEFTTFVATSIKGNEEDHFQTLKKDEVDQATRFALDRVSLGLSFGLMELGWRWAEPQKEYFQIAVESGNAWRWDHSKGLLTGRRGDEQKTFKIEFIACTIDLMDSLLMDARWLANRLGCDKVKWLAPLHSEVVPLLEAAGYARDWDKTLYIYSKRHPKQRAVSG